MFSRHAAIILTSSLNFVPLNQNSFFFDILKLKIIFEHVTECNFKYCREINLTFLRQHTIPPSLPPQTSVYSAKSVKEELSQSDLYHIS